MKDKIEVEHFFSKMAVLAAWCLKNFSKIRLPVEVKFEVKYCYQNQH